MPSQEAFKAIKVTTTRREIIFELDGQKDGCSKIYFEYGDRPDLKNILSGLFQSQDLFDFQIQDGTKTSDGKCKIDSLIRHQPI